MGLSLFKNNPLKKVNHAPCSSSDSRPLVIIVHASVGSGHRSAAQAVAQAYSERGLGAPVFIVAVPSAPAGKL